MTILSYDGTPADLKEQIRLFIGGLAGNTAGAHALTQAVQIRIANTLLSEVQQAFLVKSAGGVGSDGIKWPPLKRETIAQRRIGPGDLAAIGIKGAGQPKSRVRGLLTKAEDKQWRKIFYHTWQWLMLKFGMEPGQAKARAAQIAWAKLKAMGARTKLDVLGGRQVDILQDTGELMRSFTPGVGSAPSGADGQIVRLLPGKITVGTNKKTWHHNTKKPSRRPFWPDSGLPDAWWKSIRRETQSALKDAVVSLVRGAA